MNAGAGPHTTPYPKVTAAAVPTVLIHNVDGGWTSTIRHTVPSSTFHAVRKQCDCPMFLPLINQCVYYNRVHTPDIHYHSIQKTLATI